MSEIQRYAVIETALCIGGNLHEGEVLMVRADEHERELAALREELHIANEYCDSEQALMQAKLTAAEQRNVVMYKALLHVGYPVDKELALAALKPTESGASE
ncbi:hypothetical protein [Pseudomonas sp. LB3P58]